MAVNTTLAGLSQTASSNGPDGTTDAPSTLDDAIRYGLSFTAQLRDGAGFTAGAIPVALGYTPVQQGTGTGQGVNVVKIGWSTGSRLKATVDTTDLGNIVFDGQFPGSISSSGWEKLPNGRIKQWLIVLTNASGYVTATFPIAFPNALFGASLGSINTGSVFATWQTPSTSSILVQTWNGSSAGAAIGNSSVYVEVTGY